MKLSMSFPDTPKVELSEDSEIEVEIVVNDGSWFEYAGCGSHQVRLHLKVEKDDLAYFLSRYEEHGNKPLEDV